MRIKKIEFFFREKSLGTCTVEARESAAHVVFCVALFCPVCGMVWTKRVQSVEGLQQNWCYSPSNCILHGGGDILKGGDNEDFSNMANLPQEVLLYTFKLEYIRWQEKQGR